MSAIQWFIDKMIEGVTPKISSLPFPDSVKQSLEILLPILKGNSVLPFPSQWTSWQYFTGEADASKGVLGELVDLVGVTLEKEKGYFYVQSARHPEHIYKCEFSLNRGGYAYGIPLGKVLKLLAKALKKLQVATPWVKKAVQALRKALLVIAKHSRRLQRYVDKLPQGGQVAIDKALGELNAILDGWSGESPLQNIRRSLLNLQNPINEMGPPTGLYGPIFVVDIGVTIIGNVKLILLFMGGPVHYMLGWMPFAYKYMGANFGYGVQLAADVGMNIAYGEIHTITETNSKTGKKRTIPRPK